MKLLIVTEKQLRAGWKEFHGLHSIPNVTHHEFTVTGRTPEGHYVVVAPESIVENKRRLRELHD